MDYFLKHPPLQVTLHICVDDTPVIATFCQLVMLAVINTEPMPVIVMFLPNKSWFEFITQLLPQFMTQLPEPE
jgi:hypothetical protein